ncbi:caspase family protein [Kitasatospora sp. MAP5-34]|uniref:caspase, EACC1-associated type n=1 Tax=Kitasatospora sp. MAP5-34 TaxID=3035102 RepID=UPI002473D961|nr:caspase family protein [Kitasatospora sp. MAP5-34]MDH6579120.1 WD40 repeat protein [Kitasatospora sp. MAP5-34]
MTSDAVGGPLSATALASPGSRALLVGTGRHTPGSRLPDVPAVAATVREVARALVEDCGLRPENLLPPLIDPRDPIEFGNAVVAAAREAEDVLLVYYVGHGLVSPGNELYLATAATDDVAEGLAFKALPYQALREAFSNCRAGSVIVVLDCCFAGRARGSFGTAASDGFALAALSGTYLLASASRDEQALSIEGQPYTAFTGELLRYLREGEPGGPPELTLEAGYRHLRRVLPLLGLPAPERQLSGRAGDLVLAANPAAAVAPPTVRPPDDSSGDEPVCPYPGLEPFTADDARYFFGRGELTGELLGRLAGWANAGGPIALVGLSGAGKSSLLRAGLLPAVKRGELRVPGAGTWPQRVLTPGEHPLDALAGLLAEPAGLPRATALDGLRADPAGAAALVSRALQRLGGGHDVPGGRLLLVVDQFEELFTACQDETERRAFILALCSAAGQPLPGAAGADAGGTPPALVVLGIRADFYAACMTYPELVDALKERQLPVEPMTPGQLREAIEKPAELAGLTLEPGLADTLLRDLRAGGSPSGSEFTGGTLPLLAYALWLTWGRRAGRILTLAGYSATGGIWEAVTRHADLTYEALDPAAQRAAELLLLRMVRIGEATEDTRRVLDLAALRAERPPGEAAAIATARDALARARLITLDGDTAQITHEALLRAWRRLRGWIEGGRADLLIRQKLLEAAEEWQRTGRDTGVLYWGATLELAQRLHGGADHGKASRAGKRAAPAGGSTQLAAEFLAASIRAEQRRRRTRTGVTATLALLLVVVLIAAGFAFQGQQTALRRQREAAALALLSQADTARGSSPQLALRLGIAADTLHHTPQSTANLLSTLLTPYTSTLTGPRGTVVGLAFAPGGRLLAAADEDGTVTLWDTGTPDRPKRLGAPLTVSPNGVYAVAFSPDGHTLAAGGADSRVLLWDVSAPDHPQPLGDPLAGPNGVACLAFAPDGRTLAAGGGDGQVLRWDVRHPGSPQPLAKLTGHTGRVESLAFRPDSRVLAAGGADTAVLLWDVGDPNAPRALGGPLKGRTADVTALGFTPDGHTMATGDGWGEVLLWNVNDPAAPSLLGQLPDRNTAVLALIVGADRVDVAESDHTTSTWDTTDPANPRQIGGTTLGRTNFSPAAAFSFQPNLQGHQAQLLATGSADGTVILWDARGSGAQTTLLARLGGRSDAVASLAVSPDGRTLATGGSEGSTVLWDFGNRQEPSKLAPALAGQSGSVDAMAFSPDGHLLATGSLDTTVILWDTTDPHHPRQLRQFTANTGGVQGLAFAPVGHLLATVGGDGTAQLWDTSGPADPRPVGRPLTGHRNAVAAVAFTPDGHTLATGGWDGTVILWNTADPAHPQQLRQLDGHTNWVVALAFSPDGRTLATGSLDATVMLWDTSNPAETHRLGQPLTGHNSGVRTVAFGPDGRTLVSGSDDRTVIVWDVTNPVQPQDLGGTSTRTGSITAVAITPDGKTLLSGAEDKIVNVNDLGQLDELRNHAHELACTRASGGLPAQDWSSYLPGLGYQRTC